MLIDGFGLIIQELLRGSAIGLYIFISRISSSMLTLLSFDILILLHLADDHWSVDVWRRLLPLFPLDHGSRKLVPLCRPSHSDLCCFSHGLGWVCTSPQLILIF